MPKCPCVAFQLRPATRIVRPRNLAFCAVLLILWLCSSEEQHSRISACNAIENLIRVAGHSQILEVSASKALFANFSPSSSFSITNSDCFFAVMEMHPPYVISTLIVIWSSLYLGLVRFMRHKRSEAISSSFGKDRPLSTMTTAEAHRIMTNLQELEFPYAFKKARTVALLKVHSP